MRRRMCCPLEGSVLILGVPGACTAAVWGLCPGSGTSSLPWAALHAQQQQRSSSLVMISGGLTGHPLQLCAAPSLTAAQAAFEREDSDSGRAEQTPHLDKGCTHN